MAVPVQTWGSLGTMVQEQRDFGQQTAEFLENKEVYDLFGHLLRQVVVHQPDNPIKFLQEQLRSKPPLTVCVIGPPGINRSKYCQQIATDFKIKHIHVGKLLRAKKDLKNTIEEGALVDDDTVIEAVKAELAKSKQGWVLDGFPRTKIQAQCLSQKETGFGLDKVLLLHTGEKAIRERYAAKVAAAGYDAADTEDLINSRLQQYQRHVISICELFQNVIRQIEVHAGDEDTQQVYNVIKNNLHVRPYSNAPLRSHRICILGACASGRTTQCKLIEKQYGLVHVDPAALLKKHQEATGKVVEEVPPEWVSEEELCAVVGRRLSEVDCMRKGWVLDGFPKTVAQAEFLRQSHMWPTRLVHLKASEDAIVERMKSRKVDPETSKVYYTMPGELVGSRLVKADYDEPEQVQKRFALHGSHVDLAMQAYIGVASTVSGEDDIAEVTRKVYEKIDTPVQSELDQEATI